MALIHYYQGSMYAGKSTHAVHALFSASGYQQKLISSPSWQSRGYLSRNHRANDIPSSVLIVPDIEQLPPTIYHPEIKTLLVIDEVQFCSDALLDPILAHAAAHSDLDVIIAGLQVGQHAQPFPNGNKLLALFAGKTTILHAPCALCTSPEGLVAVRKWLINDHIRDEYSLMCKACFDKFFAYGRNGLPIPDPLFKE